MRTHLHAAGVPNGAGGLHTGCPHTAESPPAACCCRGSTCSTAACSACPGSRTRGLCVLPPHGSDGVPVVCGGGRMYAGLRLPGRRGQAFPPLAVALFWRAPPFQGSAWCVPETRARCLLCHMMCVFTGVAALPYGGGLLCTCGCAAWKQAGEWAVALVPVHHSSTPCILPHVALRSYSATPAVLSIARTSVVPLR